MMIIIIITIVFMDIMITDQWFGSTHVNMMSNVIIFVFLVTIIINCNFMVKILFLKRTNRVSLSFEYITICLSQR